MAKLDINHRSLRESLDAIIQPASQHVTDFKGLIPSIICPVFNKQGYLYTIDHSNGNFTIKVDEYSTIRGDFVDGSFRVYISSTIEAIEAYSEHIHLSLTNFSDYVQFFENLITELRGLGTKFNEKQKLKKGAELLTISFLQPYIDKFKLKQASLITPEDEVGTVIVRVPICNNYCLQSRMSFDNYEQRCEDIAMAVQDLTQFFPPKIKKLLTFHRYPDFGSNVYRVELCDGRCVYPNDFSKGEHIHTDGLNFEIDRMSYKSTAQINKLIPKKRSESQSDVVNQTLKDLGFQYYVSEGMLIVFITEESILTREESNHKVLFQNLASWGFGDSTSKTLHDEEFILLLKLIALNPKVFESRRIYKVNPNMVLLDLFLSLCPDNWFHKNQFLYDRYPLDILIGNKIWLTVPLSSGQFVNAVWFLLSNQALLNTLSTPYPDKPYIEMYVNQDYSYRSLQ